MEKSTPGEPEEVRYDSSGKKIVTPPRNKEIDSAIISINDKLDQLLGIISSTLPTKIGAELRSASSGGQDVAKLLEVVSKELPDRIKQDSSQNTFEKAEMLSIVISTSIQHLQDAFKSHQDSLLEAVRMLVKTQEKTNELLEKISLSSAGTLPAGLPKPSESPAPSFKPEEKLVTEQTLKPKEPLSEPSPFAPKEGAPEKPSSPFTTPAQDTPQEEKKETKPSWLRTEGENFGWPPPPSSDTPPASGGTS